MKTVGTITSGFLGTVAQDGALDLYTGKLRMIILQQQCFPSISIPSEPHQDNRGVKGMHESGLTEDLFTHALHHAREANARRILRVKVTIGALSDATPDSIRFYFDSLAPGTLAEGATLEFSITPGQAHCNTCGRDVTIDELFAACPACGAFPLAVTGGNAVYLDSLDVETG